MTDTLASSALQQPTGLLLAVALGVAAASATWLGWGLAAIRPAWPRSVLGGTLLLAAAAMIGLSVFEVLPGALDSGLPGGQVVVLFALGCMLALLVVRIGHRMTSSHSPLARTALLVALAIGLHNIPEGAIPVGMAMITLSAALVSTVVLAAHNVVEGLAVATPVIASGAGRRKALAYTSVAAAGELLGVLIAAQFAAALHADHIGILLAVVAGIMISVSALELLPAGIRLLREKDDLDTGRGGGTRTHDLLHPKQAR